MPLLPNVTIRIGTKDISDEPDLGLEHTTESPGGIKDCTFDLCRTTGPDFDLGDKVTIFDGNYNAYPFVGLIDTIKKKGNQYSITATRSTVYQVHRFSTVPQDISHPSGRIAGKVYKAGTPMVEALRDGLQLCADVFDGGIVDPGTQFVADSNNLGGQTAEQVWEYIASLLNNTVLLWHIRGRNGLQAVVIDYEDLAPRYSLFGVSEDDIEENFTIQAIVNRVTGEWGNDQVVQLPLDSQPIDYSQIKVIHDRFVQGGNSITRQQDAEGIIGTYMSKFGRFRSVNDSITLKCDTVTARAVSPIVPVPVDGYPLHLIEAGHGIRIMNRQTGKYFPQTKFVTGTRYNWTQGTLQLTCGEVVNLASKIEYYNDYNINRLYSGPPASAPPRWQNHPLADVDLLPTFGPEMPGDTPPSNVPGIMSMVRNDGQSGSTETPFGRVAHPDLIADEGLEANFNIPVTSLGFGGGIRVIPGTFNEFEIILGNDTGKVADTVSIDIYKDTPGAPVLALSIAIITSSKVTRPILPDLVLGRGDFLLFKVTLAATTATWAAISLHAKKRYPGLKV